MFPDHPWAWIGTRLSQSVGLAYVLPILPQIPVAQDPNAVAIGDFFARLTGDLTVFSLAMAGFFFALSALFYMSSGLTGNERMRTHAIGCLYAALSGLALALMSGTFTMLINNAASGASAGGPGQ